MVYFKKKSMRPMDHFPNLNRHLVHKKIMRTLDFVFMTVYVRLFPIVINLKKSKA